jgi:Cu(I)/Ag(I) efflux system membrane fusion protein
MKRKHTYLQVFFAVCFVLTLVILVSACGNKEEKHGKHQQLTENTTDSSINDMQMKDHDEMTGKNDGHTGHNSSPGMQMDNDTTKSDTSANDTYWNSLPTNQTVIARQQLIEPLFSDMNFTITGNGYISFDMRRNRKIPVRVGGRIERLYVKYNYQYIRKGEKILELYSPELNTYVEEYLYVSKQTNDSILQNKARQKLLLLVLSSAQVKQIDRTGNASFTIPLYSPFEGYVLFNPSASSGMGNAANTSGNMSGGMSGADNSAASIQGTVLTDNSIREGMYVSKDQTLFWINDFKETWGIIAFTKENEKYIRNGLPITINSEFMTDKPIHTSIRLIEQVYQGGQKFTQARVYIPNASGILKQNSLITAAVSVPVKSLMLPASSVYSLGKISIVWVKVGTTKEGANIFQSRVVRIRHKSGDKVEIIEGLKQDEWVAKDAGYLADSETIIQY